MKQFETFGLDEQNECLWHNGEQIALPPRTFAVLRYLVENPARLVTHDELLDKLWPDTYVQPQILRTYMLELRKVLGDDARQPRFIRSQPKRGYVFVAAVTETGQPAAPPPPPIQQATPSSGTLVALNLIGRNKELAELCAAVQQLAAGTRQMVLISGDTGMGKTALVDEFCAGFRAKCPEAAHLPIARGQCVQGVGAREQYYPILEALAHLCAGHDSEQDAERACRVLARVAPEWLPAPARAEQRAQTAERTTSDLCAALEELSADRPLVLILEDIHWADEATLDALSALARRRAPAQLMLLATFSPHHTPAEHPLRRLRHDLRMRRLCTELALAPLSRSHMTDLIRRKLEQETLPPELPGFIHQHAEGNPLFVQALLDHLIAERLLVRNGTQWEQRTPLADTGVPDELAQMIEVELQRLTPAEQRLLEAASLTSVAFPAWAVAAALEEELSEMEDACDDLARRISFIRRAGHDELPDGTRSAFYAFAHGLYREVLYQRQPVARRARRHIRIADRLERIFAGREFYVAEEIVTHLEAAGEWCRAIATLRAAARAAVERGATPSAIELLEHALAAAANLHTPDQQSLEQELRQELQTLNANPSPILNKP